MVEANVSLNALKNMFGMTWQKSASALKQRKACLGCHNKSLRQP